MAFINYLLVWCVYAYNGILSFFKVFFLLGWGNSMYFQELLREQCAFPRTKSNCCPSILDVEGTAQL